MAWRGAWMVLLGLTLASSARAQEEDGWRSGGWDQEAWDEDERAEEVVRAQEPTFAQVGARVGVGFGGATEQLPRVLIESTFRLDVSMALGRPDHDAYRLGPILEVRTRRFDTGEVALGASVLLPALDIFPITVSALIGYASESGPLAGGPIGVLTLAAGVRLATHRPYVYTPVQVYVSARSHFADPRQWEIVAGIEIDLVGVPILAGALALGYVYGMRTSPP